jgi:transcriptional regulator with XRE-family HTH domain
MTMQEVIHARIQQRLDELKLTPRSVSVQSGLDPGYLRKLLKRKSMPNSGALGKLAQTLQTSVEWLLGGASVSEDGSAHSDSQTAQCLKADLPFLHVMPSNGAITAFELGKMPVRWLHRPPALRNGFDAYAFFVPNAALRPRQAPGDLVVASNHKPAGMGDAVVIRMKSGGEVSECHIGYLAEDIGRSIVVQSGHEQTIERFDIEGVDTVSRILSIAEILEA